MALLSGWGRRLAALPVRARLALVAALVLSVLAVLLLVVPGDGGDGAGGEAPASGGHGDPLASTTLATGGIEIDAPEGWQAIPVPALGFGIAVPPGWEAAVLSPEGLEALSSAAPAVEGFVDSAHAAAASGGLLYAAGEDDQGQVSDVLVRAAPATGVTDAAGLADYARDLAGQAGRGDPEVEAVEGAALPTVRLRFAVGGGDGEAARGTETLVLADDGIVWSVVVTSDDAAVHDDLAARLTGTLAFPAR
jgi:Rieske Fe-S protein